MSGNVVLCHYVRHPRHTGTATKQAWPAPNFTAGFTQAVCEKAREAGVFANALKHVYKRAYTVYDCLFFFFFESDLFDRLLPVGKKKKKLSTHGQCERGVEGLRLCPNVVIQTSWMPFPVGIMNVKVVKGYGALDTARTH